jgi:hypothetical protein
MAEFVGSYRSQKTRRWRAELALKLLYAIIKDVAVLASSILP